MAETGLASIESDGERHKAEREKGREGKGERTLGRRKREVEREPEPKPEPEGSQAGKPKGIKGPSETGHPEETGQRRGAPGLYRLQPHPTPGPPTWLVSDHVEHSGLALVPGGLQRDSGGS